MKHLRQFAHEFQKALWSLLPIVTIVVVFQLGVFRRLPEDPVGLIAGLLIVGVGIALFLHGLDLSVFPVGKNLANQFARRGALSLLLPFVFAIGFAAVVAEPALIAVAEQAQQASAGRIDRLALRLVVATSVGLALVVGVMRILWGWAIYKLVIAGYVLVLVTTFAAPEEIIGLAYDSGGVTTNIVMVPLITAIGIGLANSLQGRSALRDGFGLVALCYLAPMIGVQLYGIWVYTFGFATDVTAAGAEESVPGFLGQVLGLAELIRDIAPMVVVVLVFQYFVLRHPLTHRLRVTVGVVMVLGGLYAFSVGLKLSLFPIGTLMAEQLIERGVPVLILLFALLIGFATAMAEPALLAIGEQAEATSRKLSATAIRLTAASGFAIGLTLGVARILTGAPLHYTIMAAYALVIVLVALAPKYITALAFDLGAVTASVVTVPLVTAIGLALANSIEGRDVLLDGFGLVASASIFPIISVLVYAMILDKVPRQHKESP
ncbi:hypothetical protein ABIE38_002693 [Dietzia sp. 2505]|uniref:DUF1538 domain-containing protein n=1 Tax=Dietzia sp. 2505 TaxID=3156457 RepID=UPI00339B19DB